MASNPIRLGIVGLGRSGWCGHCRELKGRERKFHVVAACDVLPDRLDKAAAAYGCKTYTRIEDLIADPNVEMVDIATRSSDHFEQAMMALKAGKLVTVEKPMCTTYAEAKKLRAAAKGRLLNWGVMIVDHALQFLSCPVKSIWSDLKRIVSEAKKGTPFELAPRARR